MLLLSIRPAHQKSTALPEAIAAHQIAPVAERHGKRPARSKIHPHTTHHTT
jgi:hypothetical protein